MLHLDLKQPVLKTIDGIAEWPLCKNIKIEMNKWKIC